MPRSEAHWVLSLYEDAGEASGSFRRMVRRTEPRAVRRGEPKDPERSKEVAARRARGKLRRYAVANRLNRLGTLTYRGEGNHDPHLLRAHVGEFFRDLRAALGADGFAYAWVPEWHPKGHGLHVHFAVGRFVRRKLIETAWPHGFVHIKLLGDLPAGFGVFEEARLAARYLAKYVGKSFGHDDSSGLHRYEVAQGFQPEATLVRARSADDAIAQASKRMHAAPVYVWRSREQREWYGPQAVWLAWR